MLSPTPLLDRGSLQLITVIRSSARQKMLDFDTFHMVSINSLDDCHSVEYLWRVAIVRGYIRWWAKWYTDFTLAVVEGHRQSGRPLPPQRVRSPLVLQGHVTRLHTLKTWHPTIAHISWVFTGWIFGITLYRVFWYISCGIHQFIWWLSLQLCICEKLLYFN